MKNIFILFLSLIYLSVSAQVSISFESEEGYELGTIHNQKGWEVTEHDEDGFVTNQVISDEFASDGNYAFKNGHESDYDFQFFPIFGATQMFDEPVDHQDFSISYDVMVTDKMGADFEFVLFAEHEEEWTPVAGVGIENRGYIYLIKDSNYDFDYADFEWESNEWINIRIEIDETEIRYFVNDLLEASLANFSGLDITGFNMLHNNYGHDAYYDNFVISSGSLDSPKFAKTEISVFPNPIEDHFSLILPDEMEIEKIQLFNLLGQEVYSESHRESYDISHLSEGMYVLKIFNKSGESQTQKLLKQ